MISDAALQQLKDEHPCDEFAAKIVRLRKHGNKLTGPCPICSSDRDSATDSRFEVDRDGWVCAVCADGGDVIALVQRLENLDFLAAVEWLGGARQVDDVTARQREEERQKRRAEQEEKSNEFRERERRTLYDIWLRAWPLAGSIVERYHKRRGLSEMPAGANLRCVERMPYFIPVKGAPPEVIHRGPAKVAAIIGGNGKFAGLHLTYLDLAQPKGKVVLKHPRTGEELDAKKSRGHKQGGHVELWSPPMPTRLVMGEGIETTAAAWLALASVGANLTRTAFWSALDLGNLAGKSLHSVPHPTLKDKAGRTRRVPGPWPDMESEAVVVPDSVDELVLLGDGDSDPFKTRCAIVRAGGRHARPGRLVRAAWAPDGSDMCDLLQLDGGLEQIARMVDR